MSLEVGTVLAETGFAEIVTVCVLVLVAFMSLNRRRFFDTICASNGIPG